MTTVEPQFERVVVPREERQFNFTRLFASDLRRDGLIPAALLVYPEVAALEAERQRLAAALDAAEQGGGGYVDEAGYIEQRTKALREGRDLPPPPPLHAEAEAHEQERRRNVAAATEALLRFGDTFRRTVAAHPEWYDAADEKVKAARAEAAAVRRQADEADARADKAEQYTRWLRRVSDGEVYYPTFVANIGGMPQDEPDLIWNVTDPHIAELMARSRTGSPL
jgi:hypothetical protein